MNEAINALRHDIQIAVAELRECEAALRLGEQTRAHDLIRESIVRLERLLHDAQIPLIPNVLPAVAITRNAAGIMLARAQ